MAGTGQPVPVRCIFWATNISMCTLCVEWVSCSLVYTRVRGMCALYVCYICIFCIVIYNSSLWVCKHIADIYMCRLYHYVPNVETCA